MRARKWRGTVWAARFGLLALALNSLVPIHIAFDLAEALAPAHHRSAHSHAEAGGANRHLLALLVGHRHTGGKSHDHGKGHGVACAVCSALGALAGVATSAAILLAARAPAALPVALSVTETLPARAPASYRSRAPPLA
jgi:hypothetical protein